MRRFILIGALFGALLSFSAASASTADVNELTPVTPMEAAEVFLAGDSGLEVVEGSAELTASDPQALEQFSGIDGGPVGGASSELGPGFRLRSGLGHRADSGQTPVHHRLDEVLDSSGYSGVTTTNVSALAFDVRVPEEISSIGFDFVFKSRESCGSDWDVAAVFVDDTNYAYLGGDEEQTIIRVNPASGLSQHTPPDEFDGFNCWSPALSVTGVFDKEGKTPVDGTTTHSVIVAVADTGDYIVESAFMVSSAEGGTATEGGVFIPSMATVTTEPVAGVTATNATLAGEVTADGGAAVTQRGFVYATSQDPAIGDVGVTQVDSGSGLGSFTEEITGLEPGTTYQVRAFATNDAGTSYGSTRSFATDKAAQTIAFEPVDDRGYDPAPFSVTPAASSGLPVTVTSLTEDVCTTTSDGEVTLVSAGDCTLRAEQDGDATYAAAEPVERGFAVAKAAQTITFQQPSSQTYGDADVVPAPTTDASGLNVDLTSSSPGVCTVSDGTVSLDAAGDCILVASQTGDARYEPADDVTRTLGIAARPLQLDGFTADSKVYDGTVAVSGATFDDDRLAGDDLELSYDVAFADAAADEAVQVTFTSLAISGGADQDNYTLDATDQTLTRAVEPRVLELTGTRHYDATVAVSPDAISVGNLVDGETLTLEGTGSIAKAGAGHHTLDVADLVLADAAEGLGDASNYTLDGATHTFLITAQPLHVTGAREYDGGVVVDAAVLDITGLVGDETLGLAGQGNVDAADVGEGLPLDTAGLTLADGPNGESADDYTLEGGDHRVTITAKPVSLSFAGGMSWLSGAEGTPIVVTKPEGVAGVELAYDGESAPTAAGSYRVTATLDEPNHVAAPVSSMVVVVDPPSDDRVHGTPSIGPVADRDEAGEPVAPALAPSQASASEGGEPTAVTVAVDLEGRLEVGNEAFTLSLQARNVNGSLVQVDEDAVLRVTQGAYVHARGSGFAPGGHAEVWMFSSPLFLGVAETDADGNFDAEFPIPEELSVGEHTVQLTGYSADGELRTTSVGIVVEPAPSSPSRPRPEPAPDLDSLRGEAIAGALDNLSDVGVGDAYADAIGLVYWAELSTGYTDGTFRPRLSVTRAEAASFLSRGLGIASADPSTFPDVATGSAHTGAIAAMTDAGYAEGYTDGTFRPHRSVTRGEMASLLARGLHLEAAGPAEFRDVIPGTTHADAIAAVTQAGIAEGFDNGTFGASEPMSRGQMAAFLARAFDLEAVLDAQLG